MAVSWETHARNVLAALTGWFAPVEKQTPAQILAELQAGKIRKILLVRPQQGLGDLLLFTPVLRPLLARFPHLEIQALCTPRNAKALATHPLVQKIWLFQKWKLPDIPALVRFIAALRREKFDLAVPIFSHTPSWTSFFVARFIGARIIWSFDSATFYGGNNWSRFLAHVELPPPSEALPEWKRYAALLEPLTGELKQSSRTEYHVSQEGKAWAQKIRESFNLDSNRPVVGLFLGGNPHHPGRFVTTDTWLRIAQELAHNQKVQLVIIHPPHEAFLYKEFSRRFGVTLPVVDEYDLGKVLGFLQTMDLFICPDGGTFHLAAAAGVQTLGLFMSTDAVRWCPPGEHVQAINLISLSENSLARFLTINRRKGVVTHA